MAVDVKKSLIEISINNVSIGANAVINVAKPARIVAIAAPP
jgi:hypothetical protein